MPQGNRLSLGHSGGSRSHDVVTSHVDAILFSVTCTNPAERMGTITAYEEVYTDHAHVMVAVAMLSRRVRYRSSSYHKVPAMAEWALPQGLPVRPLDPLGGS
jgi:hypothetical protein